MSTRYPFAVTVETAGITTTWVRYYESAEQIPTTIDGLAITASRRLTPAESRRRGLPSKVTTREVSRA